MILELKNIKASYSDGFIALEDINAIIKEKSFVVILGSSGSGKTTLFKVITGLLDPATGSVTINGKDVTNLLTESRDISMIFQNFVLYPHMTIYANVFMGLNGFNISNNEKDLRVKRILTDFGLRNYLNFKPRHLSDGQKQRVAMCKALVREPSIFLMDEPLSNLDLPQRVRIKQELKTIYERYNTSFVYITHELQDALMLATVVWIMERGKIIQTGTIQEIRDNPKSLKAFNLIYGGEINKTKACVTQSKIIVYDKTFNVPTLNISPGDYTLAFTYKDAFMTNDGPLEGKVLTQKITPNGILTTITLKNAEEISFYSDDEEENELKVGDTVRLQLKVDKLKFF
ncbi:MAG: Trehalose import ATP-binding protein SugC [Tenericutes bacterium ADurb.Bin087]|nr:MAG: Trehalose import ATP-binding protein SugC [Tenericutes bacterium ADurb.Bin087]